MSPNNPRFALDKDAQAKLDKAFERRDKISAVKIVQKSLGIGLAESKSYIDSLIIDPENWPKPAFPPELAAEMEEMIRSGDLVIFPSTYVREEAKVGRNEPCSCGSGKKYKKCCGA